MKKVLRGGNIRDYCLFVVGINSGLRISDLLALKVGDVVNGQGKPLERIALREKKTGKTKAFPLSVNAQKAVAEYLGQRKGWTLNQPLFVSRKGNGAIQRAQVWKVLNAAARVVGIRDRIGAHTLRKTFGFHAYKQGKDIALLQKLLNHSTPAVTLRYIGITQQEMDDVYLSLNL